jgi:hypothetical protein
MVSEAGVHAQLDPLLWGLWQGSATWWKKMEEKICSPHGGQEAREIRREWSKPAREIEIERERERERERATWPYCLTAQSAINSSMG